MQCPPTPAPGRCRSHIGSVFAARIASSVSTCSSSASVASDCDIAQMLVMFAGARSAGLWVIGVADGPATGQITCQGDPSTAHQLGQPTYPAVAYLRSAPLEPKI